MPEIFAYVLWTGQTLGDTPSLSGTLFHYGKICGQTCASVHEPH